MPNRVDCSESVEDALARLDLESKKNKAAKLAAQQSKLISSTDVKGQPSGNSSGVATGEGGEFGGYKLLDALRAEDNAKCRKLYPERGGEKYKPTWMEIIFQGKGREAIDKIKCERNVWQVIKKSHLVRIMLGALKASGCEIDIRRHISCEVCDPSVTGGYDPILNQVVICQNSCRYQGMIQGVLTHEMIHMFDYCRHKMDLKDIRHLACTEIRAANLAHCSFLSAWTYGTASPFNIKQRHQECVKQRAVDSVLAVREVSPEDARAAVDSVFEKCYADLEPIGRRIRRNSDDIRKAYKDRRTYGYDSI